jgi:hypothetical protein
VLNSQKYVVRRRGERLSEAEAKDPVIACRATDFPAEIPLAGAAKP